MKIRPAKVSDLAAVLDINLRAIFETCVSHYVISDLRQWVGDRSEKNFEKSLEGRRNFVRLVEGRSLFKPEGGLVSLPLHERHGVSLGVEATAEDLP